jgi:hypothetical protein
MKRLLALDPWARYGIVSSRLKDLPIDTEITVVGQPSRSPKPPVSHTPAGEM